MTADLISETTQARRQHNNIFKMLKEKNLEPRTLDPVKISSKQKGDL